ncbi:protein phosphatase 1 regulatory subunit 3C-like [Scleropages formosus]|uniref:protein phosphatase 1 regulatory subunit 3C-like n=1 Tax=Scleropages formosus TaxID=113540 RepID=UPI0010FACC62|nr:protein phosphatase 1 regulatory subunit 3C-like [Scleropages formosus]XP_018589998.2 protein phosphatase 1 regulatory subunit 3C-like [Scleropages formosus]
MLKANCSKMLQVPERCCFQPTVMPLNLEVQLCVSQNAPLQHLSAISSLKLLQPYDYAAPLCHPLASLLPVPNLKGHAELQQLIATSCDKGSLNQEKKRVTFSDSKGLPLTMVRYLSNSKDSMSSESEEDLEVAPGQGAKQKRRLGRRRRKLRPDFHKPKGDHLVQLEECVTMPQIFSGTVRVRNTGSQKAVNICATFDSWHSYCHVPCTPLQQNQEGGTTSLFAFSIPLPLNLNPRGRFEFYVYHPGAYSFPVWNNNMGQNSGQEILSTQSSVTLRTLQSRIRRCVQPGDAGHWLNSPMSELLVTKS